MVSLVDIGPAIGEVELRGKQVGIIGLSATHIIGILMSFPEVRKILASKDYDLGVIISQAPLAVAQMIAAGTGHADEKEHIAVAETLTAGEQYEVMTKIFELTFPKGLKSFLGGVEAVGKTLGVPGWEAATKLPEQSPPASATEGSSETASTAPQSN